MGWARRLRVSAQGEGGRGATARTIRIAALSADAARAERERAAREVRALVMHVHRLEEALGRSRREALGATARHGGGVSAQLRALCADNEVLGAYALQLERELSHRSEQQRRLLVVERALLASKKEAPNLAQGLERMRTELSAAHEHVQTLEASIEQLRAEIAFLNDQVEETEARRAQQEQRADTELDAKQRAEARCEQLDAELTHVTERLQERDQELASVKQQLEARNAEHTALAERLVAEESAHASTKAQVHQDKASTLKKKGKFLAERLRESAEAYDAAEAAARDNPFVQDQEKQKKWTKLRQLVERGIKQEKEKMERKLKKQEEVIERLFREAERRQVQVQDLEEQHAREDDLAFDESGSSHYHRGTPRGKNRKQYRTDSETSRISSSDESSAYSFSPRATEELANQSTVSLDSLAKNHAMKQKLQRSSSRTARSRHSKDLGRSKLAHATGQRTPGST